MKHILRILLLINLLLALTYKVSANENNIYWALDEVGNSSYSLTISSKEIKGEHYQNDVFDNYTMTQYVPWSNWRYSVKYVYIGDRNDIVKPDSMYYWFSEMHQLESIDFTYLDTSNVIDMSYMFQGCYNLASLDLSGFDTKNVTTMEHMFDGCNKLTTLNLSSFNTSKVTNMTGMFAGCNKLTSLNLSNFDTSKVIDMSGMFSDCSKLESLNISSFNTSSVTRMINMFAGCNELKSLDLSNFNTSNVVNMSSMFQNCAKLTSLDLSNFNTSNVTSMENMFYGCSELTSLNLSSFNTSKVTIMKDMFDGCTKLTSLNVNSFDTKNVTDMSFMFSNCSSLTTLDLSNFDTSNVTNMKYMFNGSKSLESLNVSNFDTSKVTDMLGMFLNCINLKTLDLSSFNTSKVLDMTRMFYNDYKLQVIKVSELWSTRKAGNSYDIFGGCFSLIGMNGTTGLDGANITYARIDSEENPGLLWDHIPSTLYPTIKWAVDGTNETCSEGVCKLTLSNYEISGEHLREGEFIYMDGSPWYSYATKINEVHVGSENDIIKPFKTMRSWFYSLFSVDLLDLRYLDTSNVEDMSELFLNSSIDVIVVSNRWDTSKVKYSESMFQSTCNPIIGQYGTKYDTSKTDKTYARVDTKDNPGYLWDHIPNKIYWAVDGTFCEESQGECTLKISSKQIPGNHYESGYVTELNPYGIPNYYSIKKITIGGYNDIVSVMNAYGLFENYSKIKELDLKYLDTARVTNMSHMFFGNDYLEKLDLSSLDTSRVTDMSYMFYYNYNLSEINLGDLDTSKVINMESMFSDCRNIKYLDLRSFDTSEVENMNNMFFNSKSLEQVAVSDKWDTSKVTQSSGMFYECNNIKGKNGTTRVGASDELIYARIDSEGAPGYFTDKIDRTIFSLNAPTVEFTKGKDGEVNIKFNYVDDAMGYNIYRKEYYYWGDSSKATWKKIATITNNEYLDKNVIVDYHYLYKVAAFNNGGEGPYSNEIEKLIEKPNKIQNVNVVKGSKNSIKISWDMEPYQGYYVYMGTSKDNMKRVAVINKASQNYYEAKKLKENKKYYFKVKAFAIVKDRWLFGSGDVFEARTAPGTPKASIKSNSYNSIKVAITKQSGATKYVIQRSTNSKNGFKTIATVTDLNYIDLDLTPNTKYYYKVKACNDSNICSSYTKALEGKPTLGKPSITLKTSSKKVTITLGRVKDADGYVIYRATSKKGKYSKIATLLNEEELLSFIDKTKKGKTYYYKVRTYKVINDSNVYGPYTSIKSIKSK